MAEFDLVIRGGTVVDGTGIPKFRADLGIKDGRVAMISGRINGAGAKELDASGWHRSARRDRPSHPLRCPTQLGPLRLHVRPVRRDFADGGTVRALASLPLAPKTGSSNMRMMNRIEAIPLESMRLGMRWDWETFPEYMDSLDRQGLGVNVGCLVPFSPLRGYVLGMIPGPGAAVGDRGRAQPDEADPVRFDEGRGLRTVGGQEPGGPSRGREPVAQPCRFQGGVLGAVPGAGAIRRGPLGLDHRHLRRTKRPSETCWLRWSG